MQKNTAIAAIIVLLAAVGGWGAPSRADDPPAADGKKEAATADAPKEGDSSPKSGDDKGKEGGDAKSKKPGDVSGGRFAGDPVYVHLSPIVLPIIGNTGSEQLVTIQITVQVSDFDVADDMHTNMPRVMDALIRALYGGLDTGSLRNGRMVDATKIKNKAMAAVQSVEGAANIKDVLIVNMSQRLL